MRTLQASAIPRVICGLCHRSVIYITSRQDTQKSTTQSYSEVVQWAVGSLIFLRFLIPSLILPTQSELEYESQKGTIVIGRLLMKLCCKSLFKEDSACLLNEVIQELSPHFDQFCDEVDKIGADEYSYTGPEEYRDPFDLQAIESDFRKWKTDLFEFLALDFKILVRLMKRLQSQADAFTDAHDIISRFKNEISDPFHDRSIADPPFELQ